MRKIIATISILSLVACGEPTSTSTTAADSASISKKIDNTTDKMNGMSDSTKAKMDKMVDSAKSDVKMMGDSTKMK